MKQTSFGEITHSIQRCSDKLSATFQTYCTCVEQSGNDAVPKFASWVLSFINGASDSFFFMSRPHLIFHLFRSPVHRYLFNYENRNWNLKHVIENASIANPLPITAQSLAAGIKLFNTIVEVCPEGCRECNIPFQEGPWLDLWDCIAQCVQCLPFQSGDLFSVKNGFIHSLYLSDKGAPVLDAWIEKKLTSTPPNYILIWRALMNKFGILTCARNDQWHQELDKFRSLFEDVSVNSDDISAHLTSLCEQIKWTGIQILPSSEELAELHPDIKPRSRKGGSRPH